MVKLEAVVVQLGSMLVECGQGKQPNAVQVVFMRVNILGYGYLKVACRAMS